MTQQYAEWLTAIVNTRLLFNTTEECEAFLDSGSIRSNGILRTCATPQKMRSAFRSSIRIMAFSSLCEYLRAEALR